MTPFALAMLYGMASICGGVTMVWSLWRLQVRLIEGNAIAAVVWGLTGFLGLIGMISHFKTATHYWREWKMYR